MERTPHWKSWQILDQLKSGASAIFFLNFSVSFSSILLRIPEQMTPAPSEVPQLSTVKWGQSKIVASLPVHCTLSIAKELVSKVPKWEFLVGVPSGYPNILQRYFLGIAITRQEIKCFTQVNFQFYPKKCLHRNIFGKQLRMSDILLIFFLLNF